VVYRRSFRGAVSRAPSKRPGMAAYERIFMLVGLRTGELEPGLEAMAGPLLITAVAASCCSTVEGPCAHSSV